MGKVPEILPALQVEGTPREHLKRPKCLGEMDYWGNFDCGYSTNLACEDCKYGLGRKDPQAKCNEL